MKSIGGFVFAFALALSSSQTSCWAGGSEAGNGGGLSEKNMIFAYANLTHYIDLCLTTPACGLDSAQDALLKKIQASLPDEQTVPLAFRSESKEPGFFKIDGLIRVAKTGDNAKDPIFINTDLLYKDNGANDYDVVGVPLSVSILIHELGHHQGVKDHEALDRLGSKVQILLLTHSIRAEFWNGNGALTVFQLNAVRKDEDKKHIAQIDQLILENRAELYSLTRNILENLHCPPGSPRKQPLGIRLYNLHESRGVTFDAKTQILKKPHEGWYILSCEKGAESDHGNFELELVFKKTGKERFQFLPELTQVKQISCKTDSKVCQ